MINGWIYLLQERAHLNTNIYKMGRTGNISERLKSRDYRFCKIISICYCPGVIDIDNHTPSYKHAEEVIKKEFKSQFGNPVEGSETFCGNVNKMIEIIETECKKRRDLWNKYRDFFDKFFIPVVQLQSPPPGNPPPVQLIQNSNKIADNTTSTTDPWDIIHPDERESSFIKNMSTNWTQYGFDRANTRINKQLETYLQKHHGFTCDAHCSDFMEIVDRMQFRARNFPVQLAKYHVTNLGKLPDWVAPGQSGSSSPTSRNKKRCNLESLGITPDTILTFKKDANITCRVLGGNKIEFRGEEMSLSKAALTIVNEMGYAWTTIAGPQFWMYNSKTLNELSNN